MPKKMWMVDFAREQCPSIEHLRTYATIAQEAGYDALGLYIEHRYAYRSAPWAAGVGAILPDHVQELEKSYPNLEIVPFINLLGHFEGFLYTEEGKSYREELFNGLQACPSCPEFVALAEHLLDDILADFKSNLIHIGGDETAQLGLCEKCKQRMAGHPDPKAWLYAEHFAPLARRVVAAGRTPAVWGDIFREHPEALKAMPSETVIFDWQYFSGIADSSKTFEGFRVYGCPTLHVYNAPWLHIEASERNVLEVATDVQNLGLAGTCLTQWEGALFASFDTLFPAVRWAAEAIENPNSADPLLAAYQPNEWAKLMGVELEKLGGVFGASKIRNGLKARLLLYSNPFLAWMHHGEQLCGPDGDKALKIFEQALFVANSEAEKGVTLFLRGAVEFVRMAEDARKEYAADKSDAAIGKLAPTRYLFETLEQVAKRTNERIGGSLADIERCKAARLHIEKVIQRIRRFGHRELGYLPSWEVITNPRFTPHDQGCWWLINKWANQ